MPSRPISSQTKDTEDNVVDPNPACDTLIHFSDPIVRVENVLFVWGDPSPIRPPVGMISMEFVLTMDLYCVCETLSCETTCVTKTPGPLKYTENMVVMLDDYMNPRELEELKKQYKDGKFDKTDGADLYGPGKRSLDDLIDGGFVSNDYVDNPRDANDWFSPVTDATKRAFGKYTRPNGKDSIKFNDFEPKDWGYRLKTVGFSPCTCVRRVDHRNQVSDRTFEFPESIDD